MGEGFIEIVRFVLGNRETKGEVRGTEEPRGRPVYARVVTRVVLSQ